MDESRIWFLVAKRISNEATDEELGELEAIFKANPGLQYAFSIIDGIKVPSAQDYRLTEEEANKLAEKKLQEIDKVIEVEEKEKQAGHHVIWLRRIKWAAACLLLLTAFSVTFYFYTTEKYHRNVVQIRRKMENIYSADTPTSITLQDGTQVWLNSGSTLKCASDFNEKDRQVMLSGEAYFEVTQDADRPFIVQAGPFMKVRVLGTTFNVKAYPDDPYIEASLISGKIAVRLKDDKQGQIILRPREEVTCYLNNLITSDSSNIAKNQSTSPVNYQINAITPNPVDHHISELSWMRGELAFNDMTFRELAYDLERIYHVNIVFKDGQLKNYHLTGVFQGENLNEVLQALQVTTPFQYDISNKEVIIYR